MLWRGYLAVKNLASARLALPSVFGPCMADRLPLQVGDGIGAGAGQRHNVILAITRTSAAGFACRWAGMLAMEFPCFPVLPRGT